MILRKHYPPYECWIQLYPTAVSDCWIQYIQLAADVGNIRAVCDAIKKDIGPVKTKTVPLKSTTGEGLKTKASRRRGGLSFTQTYLIEETLDQFVCLLIMGELEERPTVEEVSKAMNRLPPGKAPGMDESPPEIIKSAKIDLLKHLHELLCQCWEEGEVPQDVRYCNIITLYKNGGLHDRHDILPAGTTGEVLRTAAATVHRIH